MAVGLGAREEGGKVEGSLRVLAGAVGSGGGVGGGGGGGGRLVETRKLEGGGAGGTRAVCWHGGHVMSGGGDGKVRVWDVEEGRIVKEEEGHGGKAVTSMHVYGDRMVTGGVDGMVVVWEVGGGGLTVWKKFDAKEKGREGAGVTYGVTSVCGYGSRVYAGVAGESEGKGHDVLVWDTDAGEGKEYVNRMAGHKSWVTGMAIVMKGKFMATASLDCSIRIWSIQGKFFTEQNTHKLGLRPLKEDRLGLCGVVGLGAGWSEGKEGLVTISEGGVVDLWEVTKDSGSMEVHHVEEGRHGEAGEGHRSVVLMGEKGSGGKGRWRVASAGPEGRVKVWGVGEAGDWVELDKVDVAGGVYGIEGCSVRGSDGGLAVGLGAREEGGKVDGSLRVFC